MAKFKVGDMVRVVGQNPSCGYWMDKMDQYVNNGQQYQVSDVDAISVTIDGWWFPNETIELATPVLIGYDLNEEAPKDALIEQRRALRSFLGD